MNVKLNYGSWLDTEALTSLLNNEIAGEVLPTVRENLERVLEQYGAVVDTRERLIPQPVIYAEMNDPAFVAKRLALYGLCLEQQNKYEAKDG